MRFHQPYLNLILIINFSLTFQKHKLTEAFAPSSTQHAKATNYDQFSQSSSDDAFMMSNNKKYSLVINRFGSRNGGDKIDNVSSTQLCMNKKKKGTGGGKKKANRASPKGFAGALRELQMSTFPYAGDIKPGKQSPQKTVMEKSVVKPDYSEDGIPKSMSNVLPWIIEVKTPAQIEKMRAAGRVAREVLDIAGRAVKVGVTTDEIDNLVHAETIKRGAYPSPLNYHGFPKSCCTSVNEVICHGIPDDRKLQDGDIINIDITCYLDGFHGDCSEMFTVGTVNDEAKRLLQTTYDCWVKSMNHVKPGNNYKEIGGIIEDHIVERGFTTVRNFCGHGIGSVFHTNPNIYHYKNDEPTGVMAEGHTFTIEPMICEGTAQVLNWPDKWTATTTDGKRTAQFEHTLLVTPDGVEALTGKLETSPLQFWERESTVHDGVWLGTSESAKTRAIEVNNHVSATS
eukprot:CAMPEP_0184865262 /NCGR_PEP_ID=MMETSP0580-20130426/17462_1 /TAXON_ID=1118495 /ORGANISM="Dactyliosolen fragilissimus" /LENGTH=454 /DNA_ID=CAMNT_0027364379 /DNA_START=25 /DNA_END=1389 /DNA_ORIENTATION=+